MIIRIGATACLALGLLASAAVAQDKPKTCCLVDNPATRLVNAVAKDWKRNNCWPEPFLYPDRQNTRASFVIMVNNGWRRQNLLSADHFQPDGSALNLAGQEKLRWIITQVPEEHRTVFVSRGTSLEETAGRIAVVQKAAGQMVFDGPIPPILETNVTPPGWPAEQVDFINRKFQESAPPPRLPAEQTSNNSSDTTAK